MGEQDNSFARTPSLGSSNDSRRIFLYFTFFHLFYSWTIWTTDISPRVLHFSKSLITGIYSVFFHKEAYGLFEDLSLLEELSIFLHLIKQLTLRHIYNLKSDNYYVYINNFVRNYDSFIWITVCYTCFVQNIRISEKQNFVLIEDPPFNNWKKFVINE
jgi:hypothetical protein